MKFFDSHAHYYDERLTEGGGVDSLIDTLLSENTSYIVNIGTSPETSRDAIAQAVRHDRMYAAAGIHPSVEEAQRAMASGISDEYHPNLERKSIYDKLYARYLAIGKQI